MPQPIDPHTELGRATAAERIQQIADRTSLAAQARVASEATNGQRAAETQVQHTASKNDEVDRELRRRNPYVGKRRKREQGSEQGSEHGKERRAMQFYNASEKEVLADDPLTHDFDVEI